MRLNRNQTIFIIVIGLVLVCSVLWAQYKGAWKSGSVAGRALSLDSDVTIEGGNRLYWIDASGADSAWIYNDGTNIVFDSDNTLKMNQPIIFSAFSTGDFGNDEYDIRVGENDSASVMRIGNLEFGTSDDRTVGASFTAGGATYFASVAAPDGVAEFVFTTSDGDMRLVLPVAGVGYGTYNPRSMIIAGPSVFKDSIMIGTYWGFNRLLMDTDSTGADLGVQNDVQIGNRLFIDNSILIGGEQFTSQSDSTIINSSSITTTGNVGVGTTAIATSAALEVSSTTGALLIPRMTTTQRDALTAVNGMIVYNTTTNAFNFYEDGSWVTK